MYDVIVLCSEVMLGGRGVWEGEREREWCGDQHVGTVGQYPGLLGGQARGWGEHGYGGD